MEVNKLSESLCMHRLDEELLVEGPVSWIKDRLSTKIDQKDADKRVRDKEAKKQLKTQNKKAPLLLANDFASKNSRSTFYINNDYDHPMSQSQWKSWVDSQQGNIDKITDKNKKAEAEKQLLAVRYNSIVVSEDGYYVRRGAENLELQRIKFQAGVNDEISSGYFMQPYNYKKATKSRTSVSVSNGDVAKFKDLCAVTGMAVFGSDGKQLSTSDIKDIKLQNLSSYKVKIGSIEASLPDWIQAARKKKIL